jgi:hypothetical protein
VRKLVAALVAGSVFMTGCSEGADQTAPALKLSGVIRHPPGAHDTALRVRTTDVQGCASADNKVVDVNVDETAEEIVVGADLELPNEVGCEIRPVREGFTIELDRPLGRRLVIDNSRGHDSVIWSPKRRRALIARLRVTSADAEEFMRSKYPAATNAQCNGTDNPILFACELRVPSRVNPVLIYGQVRSGGTDLKAIPDRPSPDLREALKD